MIYMITWNFSFFVKIQEDFEEAARIARDEIPGNIPGEDKLALYGLYKQAKEGDNTAGSYLFPLL